MALPSPTSLSAVGAETMKLLDQLKAINQCAGNPNLEWPQALFSAEVDRFKLWAVNLGLFVPGHGSLDYRVRDAESLMGTLRRFMTDLNESLKEGEQPWFLLSALLVTKLKVVLEYCNPSGRLSSQDHQINTENALDESQSSLDDDMEDDTDSNSESDIDLLLDSVRDPINRLYKLSVVIRSPISRLGSTKAQRYQQIDAETGINLLDTFKTFDYDYVSSLFLEYRKLKALGECDESFPSNSENPEETKGYVDHVWEPQRTVLSQYNTELLNNKESFLVRRISNANVRRRQQFAYWQKHRDKLNRHASTFTEPLNGSRNILPGQVYLRHQPNTVSDSRMPLVESVTTATHLNIPQLSAAYERSTVSISEYAPSAWQPGKEVVGFPDPPKHPGPGENFFECPFCFTLCSTDILTPKAWKAHLIHDLRPYICTYEDCRNPDQQYDSRQDWISHEDSGHRRVWRCPEHSTQPFLQLVEYQEHLRNEHHNSADKKSNDPMDKAGESTLSSPDRPCPICSLSLETAKALQSHIALHLERFSVFSLPRSIDANDDADEEDSNAANIALEGSRDEDVDWHSEIGGEGDERKSAVGIAQQRWKMLMDKIRLGVKIPDLNRHLLAWMGIGVTFDDSNDSMYNQAVKSLENGKLEEAEILFRQIRDIRVYFLGQGHPFTNKCTYGLSSVYKALQKRPEEDEDGGLPEEEVDVDSDDSGMPHEETEPSTHFEPKTENSIGDPGLKETGYTNHISSSAILDTGSDVSWVSKSVLTDLDVPKPTIIEHQVKISFEVPNLDGTEPAKYILCSTLLDPRSDLSWITRNALRNLGVADSGVHPILEKDWKTYVTSAGPFTAQYYIWLWYKIEELVQPWEKHMFHILDVEGHTVSFNGHYISNTKGWVDLTLSERPKHKRISTNRGGLSEEVRAMAKQLRKVGPCTTCKKMKIPCDLNEPCKPCKRRSKSAQQVEPCVRQEPMADKSFDPNYDNNRKQDFEAIHVDNPARYPLGKYDPADESSDYDQENDEEPSTEASVESSQEFDDDEDEDANFRTEPEKDRTFYIIYLPHPLTFENNRQHHTRPSTPSSAQINAISARCRQIRQQCKTYSSILKRGFDRSLDWYTMAVRRQSREREHSASSSRNTPLSSYSYITDPIYPHVNDSRGSLLGVNYDSRFERSPRPSSSYPWPALNIEDTNIDNQNQNLGSLAMRNSRNSNAIPIFPTPLPSSTPPRNLSTNRERGFGRQYDAARRNLPENSDT